MVPATSAYLVHGKHTPLPPILSPPLRVKVPLSLPLSGLLSKANLATASHTILMSLLQTWGTQAPRGTLEEDTDRAHYLSPKGFSLPPLFNSKSL